MDPQVRAAWDAARPTRDHAIDVACPAPWLSLEFDPAGWVYVCCASHLYPLGRIGDDRLADLWAGPRIEVLRDALASWDLTVACGPCRFHLEHARFDPLAVAYDEHRIVDPQRTTPTMMQFALSNRCNLACEMCNPSLSSRLRTAAGLAPLPNRYDDRFFEELEPLLADLRLAKFQGGEPFLVPEHRRVWELLDRLERPPSLVVTTNGTVWTDTVAWVVDRFDTHVSISVDAATPETYASVRHGGDFDAVLANVERFDEAARRQGRRAHVSFCLLVHNWRELGAFLRWADRFDAPAAINLVSDAGLALHDLPLDQLEEVLAAWRAEERGWSTSLGANRGVWQTQLAQLDAVIGERRRDGWMPPRQVEAIPPAWFARAVARARTGRVREGELARQRARLVRWCEGGPVAALEVDLTGAVAAVGAVHPRLGIGIELVGRPIEDLPVAIAVADGRPIWLLDEAMVDGVGIVTFVLSDDGHRGTRGSVVRVVRLPRPQGGHDVLVAEDRMYERTDTPVVLRGTPTEVSSPADG